jgi:hypothetical protein
MIFWHKLRYLKLKAGTKTPKYRLIFFWIDLFKYSNSQNPQESLSLFNMILIRCSMFSDIVVEKPRAWRQDHPKPRLVVVAVRNLRNLPSTWWFTTAQWIKLLPFPFVYVF